MFRSLKWQHHRVAFLSFESLWELILGGMVHPTQLSNIIIERIRCLRNNDRSVPKARPLKGACFVNGFNIYSSHTPLFPNICVQDEQNTTTQFKKKRTTVFLQTTHYLCLLESLAKAGKHVRQQWWITVPMRQTMVDGLSVYVYVYAKW